MKLEVLRSCWLAMAVWLALSGAERVWAQNDFPGNPPITPRWAYEPWAWEDDTHTTASSEGLISNYLALQIPVGVIDLDDAWSTAYDDFVFNTNEYANPAGLIQYFATNGVRVVCWMVGMVNVSSPSSKVPDSEDPGISYVLVNRLAANNNTEVNWWEGGGLAIDFSNTNAVNWFMGRASNLLTMGVSGFKVDQSDGFVPDPVATSPGSVFAGARISRAQFTQYYYAEIQNWLNTQVITLNGTNRTNEGITFARPYSYQEGAGPAGGPWSGGTGMPVSQLTAGWCGDFNGTFGATGFGAQLTNIYASVAAGYSACGFEIGGFLASPTRDSLLREAEYAALMPIMENGGQSAEYHEPWYWDTNGYTGTVSTYLYYATLHHNLVPFLFHCGINANLTDTIAMTDIDTNTDRHLLGNALLTFAVNADTTPVTTGLTGTNSVTVDFPSSNLWINWWDYLQTFYGGTQTNLNYNLATAPIFVRAGSILPLNVDSSVTGFGTTNSAGSDTVLMFPDQTNQLVYHRPLGDGITYENDTISVAEGSNGYVQVNSPTSQSWIFQIVSFAAPTNVTGAASWIYNSTNNLLTVSATGAVFTVSVSPLAGYAAAGPPSPKFIAVNLGGNGLTFSGTGGVSNANYYLLTSTNLAAPLSNWPRLLTNQFDNYGNFNLTNVMNANAPQNFYMLQTP